MVQKLVILLGVFMSASCMLLHEAPLVYLPIQYQEPTPNYNYAYEVNDAHTGDYKRLQETRIGGAVLGQYSLLQPDGVTRTVDYRADDINGFNAVVNNIGRPTNLQSGRQEDNAGDASAINNLGRPTNFQSDRQGNNAGDVSARQSDERPQTEQLRQNGNSQQGVPAPSTVAHTSLIHHVVRKWS